MKVFGGQGFEFADDAKIWLPLSEMITRLGMQK
jgi:hypothetical protein